MITYGDKIMSSLKGETAKEKYFHLKELLNENKKIKLKLCKCRNKIPADVKICIDCFVVLH